MWKGNHDLLQGVKLKIKETKEKSCKERKVKGTKM
jgi:hypothetical protein